MHGDHFTLGAELQRTLRGENLDPGPDRRQSRKPATVRLLCADYVVPAGLYRAEGRSAAAGRRGGRLGGLQACTSTGCPGQTEFGNCLWLELDGKRIAFTGDNLFGDPADPTQNGHEAVVARNSAIFEEGYLLGSRYLCELKPDIIMGAHNVLMTNPAAFVERYHEWSQEHRRGYKNLLA